MNLSELRKALARGEDSSQQFKADVKNPESLAGEMVAFSNAAGGRIFIGVSDEGEIVELLPQETRRLNQLIANTATNNVRPPVNPHTENITTPSGVVMIVTIAKGVSPPYADNNGAIWVKNGRTSGVSRLAKNCNGCSRLQVLYMLTKHLLRD
jgi:ATP-dependent DNA helicase RecG